MKRTRRKLKKGRIIACLSCLVIIVFLVILHFNTGGSSIKEETMDLASDDILVQLYLLSEEDNLSESEKLVRGTKVTSYDDISKNIVVFLGVSIMICGLFLILI